MGAACKRVAEVRMRVLDVGAAREDDPAGDDDEHEDEDLEQAQTLSGGLRQNRTI